MHRLCLAETAIVPDQMRGQALGCDATMQALLDAGASIHGKTHMDEIAWSLQGENFHYGTPINPACPDRIPGGSSSGSVVSPPALVPAQGSISVGAGQS